MLSGVDPRKHLQQFGIAMKSDVPVGNNLQDHVIVSLFCQMNKFTAQELTLQQQMDNLYQFIMHRTGSLTGIGIVNLAGLINTVNRTGWPDVKLQLFSYKRGQADLEVYLDAIELQEQLKLPILNASQDGAIVIGIVEMLRPKSSGYIELKSTNPFDHPKIFANYLDDMMDVGTLLRGIKFQSRFVDTKAFPRMAAELIRLPLPKCDEHIYQSNDYWRCSAI